MCAAPPSPNPIQESHATDVLVISCNFRLRKNETLEWEFHGSCNQLFAQLQCLVVFGGSIPSIFVIAGLLNGTYNI